MTSPTPFHESYANLIHDRIIDLGIPRDVYEIGNAIQFVMECMSDEDGTTYEDRHLDNARTWSLVEWRTVEYLEIEEDVYWPQVVAA